jgi:hypothetical protein
MALEERVSRLEGAYGNVDARLAGLDRSVESLRAEMHGLRSEMNTRFDLVDRRFNNLYLLIGGSWVTIMASIMATLITLIAAN